MQLNIVHPDEREAADKKWKAHFRAGEFYSAENRIMVAPNEYKWFMTRCSPIYDSTTGKIVKVEFWHLSTTIANCLSVDRYFD